MKTILHIGSYKTGTSALQNFLYKNRQRIIKYGIYYGNTWKIVNNHAGLAYAVLKEALIECDLINQCMELKDLDISPENEIMKMRFLAEERGAHTIIISHEGFFADLFQVSAGLCNTCTEAEIYNINEYICDRLKGLLTEAEVVCYLRRQDLYIESMYKEYCKVPWRAEETPVYFEEFFEKQKLCLDYNNEASRWKKRFGGNAHFRVYDSENLLDGDIISDFLCRYAGLSPEDIRNFEKVDISEANVSLTRDALEHKLINKVNDVLLNYIYKVYSQENPDNINYTYIQECERVRILDKYKESNKCLFGEKNFKEDIVLNGISYPGLSDKKQKELDIFIDKLKC